MAKWLEQVFQWHKMCCHDLEVMHSNPSLSYHAPLSTQQCWIPGGMKIGELWMTSAAENALNSPQKKWDWIRESSSTKWCNLWSLLSSRGISDCKHTQLHLHFWKNKVEDVKIVWNNSLAWSIRQSQYSNTADEQATDYVLCLSRTQAYSISMGGGRVCGAHLANGTAPVLCLCMPASVIFKHDCRDSKLSCVSRNWGPVCTSLG